MAKKNIYTCNACRMVFDPRDARGDESQPECPFCRSTKLTMSSTRFSFLLRFLQPVNQGGCGSKGRFG